MINLFSKKTVAKFYLKKQITGLANKHTKVMDNGFDGPQLLFIDKETLVLEIQKTLHRLFIFLESTDITSVMRALDAQYFDTPSEEREDISPMVASMIPGANKENWLICRYLEVLFFDKKFNPTSFVSFNKKEKSKIDNYFCKKVILSAFFLCFYQHSNLSDLADIWANKFPINYFSERTIRQAKHFIDKNRELARSMVVTYSRSQIRPTFRSISYYFRVTDKETPTDKIRENVLYFIALMLKEYAVLGLRPPTSLFFGMLLQHDAFELPPVAHSIVQNFIGFSFEEMTLGYKPEPIKPVSKGETNGK